MRTTFAATTMASPRVATMRLATMLMASLLMAACGTAPRVEIVEAVPVATVGSEQEWALVVRVHNPKDAPLVLDGWRIDAGGRTISWVATRTVPPREAIQESLPVVLAANAGSWSVEGEMTYIAPGRLNDILFDSGFSRPSVGFAGTPAIRPVGSAPAPSAVDGIGSEIKPDSKPDSKPQQP
jgi:hypothetical protein